VRAALAVADDHDTCPSERAEMLMDIATDLQRRPKSSGRLQSAVQLYDTALKICPENEQLLRARITACKGTALQVMPGQGSALERARAECVGNALRRAFVIGREAHTDMTVVEDRVVLAVSLFDLVVIGRSESSSSRSRP
jgi:hypothetical protein